MMEYKS